MDWTLFNSPSLLTRIAVGKTVGLVFGVSAFSVLTLVYPQLPLLTRVGVLLWYPTVAAFIALFGVMNWHPLLQIPLPWWFRATLIGAWMNFVLTFFAYNEMAATLQHIFAMDLSPFWYTAAGGVIGCGMGYLITKVGGEGPATLERMSEHV